MPTIDFLQPRPDTLFGPIWTHLSLKKNFFWGLKNVFAGEKNFFTGKKAKMVVGVK